MKWRNLFSRRILTACGIAGGILITAVLLSAQSLTFTSPSGDTTWEAGTTQTITWTIRAPNPSVGRVPVRLLYQVGRSGAWTEIGQIEAFRQRHDWEIPASVSGRVMIRAIWTLSVPITVNSPAFRIRGTRAGLKKIPSSVSAVKRAPAADSDYSVDSVVFQDGRALSEGVMYSPEVANDMRLIVRIVWNKVPGRYGIQCDNHKLAVLDSRGTMILNPVTVPAPDRNGLISMPVPLRVPRGLREGSVYSFRVRFQPADPECDSNSSNNERSFSTRLLRMGGNDLVVRVVEVKKHYSAVLAVDLLRVTYEIMNVSGPDTLRRVQVGIDIEGTRSSTWDWVENLRPGVWKRGSALLGQELSASDRRGESLVIVTVDLKNEIVELREDNNRDGKRFRWD